MTQIPLALQLYTVRDEAERSLVGTFNDLATIGYTNVELAGLYGLTSSQLKKHLEASGLIPISAHVSLEDLEGNQLGTTIETYLDLGVTSLVVPWIGEDIRKGGTGYAAVAQRLNDVGELLSKYGVTLGYHNHDFEFEEMYEGKSGLEILIEHTDPSVVSFELDTYWALFSGTNPAEFVKTHPTRFSLLHIKDMDAVDRSFAPVGTGVLPLAEIIDAAVDAGVRYLIIEQDTTKGPSLEAVKISLDNLKLKGYA